MTFPWEKAMPSVVRVEDPTSTEKRRAISYAIVVPADLWKKNFVLSPRSTGAHNITYCLLHNARQHSCRAFVDGTHNELKSIEKVALQLYCRTTPFPRFPIGIHWRCGAAQVTRTIPEVARVIDPPNLIKFIPSLRLGFNYNPPLKLDFRGGFTTRRNDSFVPTRRTGSLPIIGSGPFKFVAIRLKLTKVRDYSLRPSTELLQYANHSVYVPCLRQVRDRTGALRQSVYSPPQ